MRKRKKTIPIWLILFILTVCGAQFSFSENISHNNELYYLQQKGDCNYERAISELLRWTLALQDPHMVELNVLRMQELMLYPELFDLGIEALSKIRKMSFTEGNPFLKARIDHVMNRLLLQKGRLADSQNIIQSFGFFDFYVAGPFAGASIADFEKAHDLEKKVDLSQTYPGKTHKVAWTKASLDRTGKAVIDNVMPETRDALFYLYKEFYLEQAGEYFLITGKTGLTDIWLDGNKVFKNRNKHRFMHDQYFMKVQMSQGKHWVLIKTSDAFSECAFSMRIAASGGKRLVVADAGAQHFLATPGLLKQSGIIPALAIMQAIQPKKDLDFFRVGQFYYLSHLSDQDNKLIVDNLSQVLSPGDYFPFASLYLGDAESDLSQKQHYYVTALKSKTQSETLSRLVALKLDGAYTRDAHVYLKKIAALHSYSPGYYINLAHFYLNKKWDFEMLALAKKIESKTFTSISYSLLAHYYFQKKSFKQALYYYQKLCDLNRYDEELLTRLFMCHKMLGNAREMERLLYLAIALFPDSIQYRLLLADVIEKYYGPAKALPVISSALRMAPENKHVLRITGMLYHRLNKEQLAFYYLQQAIAHDPDNFSLQRYYALLKNSKEALKAYVFAGDIAGLNQRTFAYRDEPVIVLLDEQATRINIDGSYEKHVRKIVKINDLAHARAFKQQYVIFDPGSERMENIKCVVINNNNSMEISGRYYRSLSDPASRLYYNQQALIVPVSYLRKGSIIDFSYTLVNSSARDYKNYFGEKMIIGGKYRTLLTNIILSFPPGKKIFCHMQKIPEKNRRLIKGLEEDLYIIKVENSFPYKTEDNMPHDSENLARVYFTTFNSWDSLHHWYRSLLKNKIICSMEMRKDLNSIIKDNDPDVDKVKKIYDLVTGKMRYVGLEFGISGIEPRRSDLTYMSKMGDCKDITLVLMALMREAGIQAGFALIRTRDNGRANFDVPFLGDFNHAICYVKAGGTALFLDGTSSSSGFRELPPDDNDVMTLVFHQKGYEFVKTTNAFYSSNQDNVENSAVIDATGSVSLHRRLVKQGSYAVEARTELKHILKKIKSINSYWNKQFPGSKVSGFKTISTSKNKPVSYSYSLAMPSFAHLTKDELIFPAFLMPSGYYAHVALLKDRKFPIVFSGRATATVRTTYKIPKNYTLYHLPQAETFFNKNFSAQFNYMVKDDLIMVSSVVRIKSDRIETGKEYHQFRKFARFITRKEIERIILIKK